jgi:hypothetical protein
VNRAVAEEQRQGQIIGYTLGAKFLEDREVHRAIRVGEPTPDRFLCCINPGDRVFPKLRRVEQPEPPFGNFDVCPGPPDKSATDDLRVKGIYKHGDPPQRDAVAHKPAAQLGQYLLRQWRRAGAVDQPIGNRSDVRVEHWT